LPTVKNIWLACSIAFALQTDAGFAQLSPLDSAKTLVASNRIREAIPLLERIRTSDPQNAAHNYFLGLCLVRENTRMPEAIALLEKASAIYGAMDVDPGMGEPEFVHFYLVIAYSRAFECEKALQRYYELVEVYSKGDPFYPTEAMKWVELCHEPQRMLQELQAQPNVAHGQNPMKDRLVPFRRDSVVTRPKEFTTRSVLYGVQVGALLKPTYTAHFPGLRNVEVYVDENGIYRYVIGNLNLRSQAEKLLNEVRASGYPDAFIVDINNPVRYRDEVVLLNDLSIQRQINGNVEFRVQIGAFAEVLPDRLAQLYLQLENLREVRMNELTLLTVGPYNDYANATEQKERMVQLGFADAFVTAFDQGQRIPVGLAIKHLERSGQAR
jgi:tetratricopeptide (TPR) repeat protein